MEFSLFILIISLLLLHEMDAIRTKEWKMFIVLKDMADETAYKIFTLAHLPLYFTAFYVMINGNPIAILIFYYVIDIFLIGHSVVHYAFKSNPNNGFTSVFSKTIIYVLGFLAIAHLCILSS